MNPKRFRIPRDTPSLCITAVAHDRLPVFRTDLLKAIACEARHEDISQQQKLAGLLLQMFDHAVSNRALDVPQHLRCWSRTVGQQMYVMRHEESLRKLRHQEGKRRHRYSLWGHESNVFSVFSESMLMQKVNYIHLNPVRAGLVERAVDYRWSSARLWQRRQSETEPLIVDIDRIQWRSSVAGA
jgi:hypothetical protein